MKPQIGIENEANVDWEIIVSNVPPCASELSAFLAATAMLKSFTTSKVGMGLQLKKFCSFLQFAYYVDCRLTQLRTAVESLNK